MGADPAAKRVYVKSLYGQTWQNPPAESRPGSSGLRGYHWRRVAPLWGS